MCDEGPMSRLSSSAVVIAVAVTAALGTSWAFERLGRDSRAWAATPAVVSAPETAAPGRIARAADGHYWTVAQSGGRAVRLMVDTGATLVVLTPEDATRLGLAPPDDAFTETVRTASGDIRAARVRLDDMAVAGVRVSGVEALVVASGLSHSLLGMSFLGRLSGFEASAGELVLKP